MAKTPNIFTLIEHGLEHEVKAQLKHNIVESCVAWFREDIESKIDIVLKQVVFDRVDTFERADTWGQELHAYIHMGKDRV